jgi:NAD(P)-dependent dehydrogenase (short-subunit alcohol dehydrogenase family)
MKDKIILVTGANSGMGKATVAALSDRSAKVIMLCRSIKRGKQAFDEIMQTPGRDVRLMLCDLGSMESIRAFAKSFKAEYSHLDVLINNAGVITLDRRETSDGLELQFGVNHIGHFMLTLLMLELLKKVPDSRIVIVGSGAHKVGKIHFDDLGLKKYNVIRSYSQSKLSNLLFARELDRRLKEKNIPVTVNVAHPGAVATQMGVDRKTQFGKTIVAMLKPFFLTPAQGARTAVFLATDPSVADVSGQYFYKSKIAKSSKRSWDMESAKKLFELSEKISGVYLDHVL